MEKALSVSILWCFLVTIIIGPNPVYAHDFYLPPPGAMVRLSPEFNPPVLKGIKVHPDNPFRFDFILEKGDEQLGQDQIKEESTKLIKYFLASITIPDKDLWVNLSPYEKDRIIPKSFGLTEMGRDLLAEDYMLKQITASLIYPEDKIGKKFWGRIYEEAEKKFGTTNIPVNTFNKVWIVPQKAVVYENVKAGTAYIVESKLKVMLDQDYLALSKNSLPTKGEGINAIGSQIVRANSATSELSEKSRVSLLAKKILQAIVLPELTKEVNENKNFSQLRQVYNSLILATWYKKKIKDSILAQVYEDKKKIVGVGYKRFLLSPNTLIVDPEQIYQQYLKAFKKGVYNYIKEEIDPITQQLTPRKYFSGGFNMAMTTGAREIIKTTFDAAMLEREPSSQILVEADLVNTQVATPEDLNGNGYGNGHKMNGKGEITAMIGNQAVNSISSFHANGKGNGHVIEAEKSPQGDPRTISLRDFIKNNLRFKDDAEFERIIFSFGDSKLKFREGLSESEYEDEIFNLKYALHEAIHNALDGRTGKIIVTALENGILISNDGDVFTNIRKEYYRLLDEKLLYLYYNHDGDIEKLAHKGTFSFAFNKDEFGDSFDKIEPLLKAIAQSLAKLGRPSEDLNNIILSKDINSALDWLNKSKAPFQIYANDVIERLTEEEITRMVLSSYGQERKRAILNQHYPQETPTPGAPNTYKLATQEDLRILFSTTEGQNTLLYNHYGISFDKLNVSEGGDKGGFGVSSIKKLCKDYLSGDYRLVDSGSETGEVSFEIVFTKESPLSIEQEWNETTSAQDIFRFKDYLFKSMFDKGAVKPYQTTIDLIKKLAAAGYRMGVGSSSRRARAYLDFFGITDYFKDAIVDGHMVVSGEVEGKPSGEFFRAAAHKAGLEPQNTIVFEDSVAGIESAKAGGFGYVIAIARNGDFKELDEAGADQVIEDVSDLSKHMTAIDQLNIFFPGFQGVIFDVDGVISNTQVQHFSAWQQVLDRYFKYKQINKKFTKKEFYRFFSGKTITTVVSQFMRYRGIQLPDKAQLVVPSPTGGIDLTPANVSLQTQNAGEGIKFHLDPAMLAQLQNTPGFTPVIINIQPMNDLQGFLGLNKTQAVTT